MNLTITAMGAKGEGAADTDKGIVHVPFALPGETVNAAVNGSRGTVMSLLTGSADRIEAVCRHFEVCGGCVVQHWKREPMLGWKSSLVLDALKSRGINSVIQPIVAAHAGERRRATFTVREERGRKVVGYNAAQSHEVIEISECPVANPQIVASLPLVRSLANLLKVKKEGGHIAVTLTESGLDFAVSGIETLKPEQRRQLAEFALKNQLARLSNDVDVILELKKPVIHFGPVPVTPPPGGFLQAVASVEDVMAAEVIRHFGKAKRALDLFAGSGALHVPSRDANARACHRRRQGGCCGYRSREAWFAGHEGDHGGGARSVPPSADPQGSDTLRCRYI